MARWRTIDFRCSTPECNHFEILLLDLQDPAELNIEGEVSTPRVCPMCGNCTFERTMKMPLGLRASYADGQKRKGWAELREASKLEKEKAVTRSTERRKELEKEIKKTGVKISK